ncbi:TPA: hypothetical protein ACYSPK_001689, partial [Yersinia enterocolitica]
FFCENLVNGTRKQSMLLTNLLCCTETGGLTAPMGAPAAHALVFETKSDPFGTFPRPATLSMV